MQFRINLTTTPMNYYSYSYLKIPAFFCLYSLAYAEPVSIIDGTFDSGQGAWVEVNGDGTFIYDYPTTGGNPGGNGVIDNTGGGGWGIWVSNFEANLLLADLGLEASKTYTFSQDMKLLSGSNIGGFKVDFFIGASANGSTGDMYLPLIGDGSTWETYNFTVSIPSNTDEIKIVPLWGPDSSVAYDNILVDDTEQTTSSTIPDADFEAADGLAWEQTSGAGDFTFTFPETGGNPGGHGRINNTSTSGWAVLVTDNGSILNLDSIGLTAGSAYLFKQDMKIFSGSNLGGFKVDFFNGGNLSSSTGDIKPQLIGDGSTWETYDFEITIPAEATGIKVVPLWGVASDVGFDNIVFDPEEIVVPEIAEIPDFTFDIGDSAWQEFGGPATTFSYESTGGNADGHAVMTNDGTGFGVIVSNNGGIIPLSGLGLTAGEAYRFQQDMKLLSGTEIGGLKVEFYRSGAQVSNTGDLRIPMIGNGSTWETYLYEIAIPLGTDGIKVVPLWGPGSSVGIDNVTYSTTPIPSPAITNFDFESGGANWVSYSDNGQSNFSYPDTGGNPGGFGQIENTASWAVLVANDGNPAPLSKFGITEEGNYNFQMDMKIIAGQNIGGLKVEYYTDGTASGDSGEIFPVLIGDGSTWETYDFEVYIPGDINQLKVVPLWGIESTVGFDNIITPQASPSGFNGWVAQFPGVGTQIGFNDDPDQDGQPNGLENFLGSDPSVFSAGLTLTISGSVANPIYSIVHSQNDEPAADISTPVYQWSSDLVTYYTNGESDPNGTAVFFDPETNTPSAGTTTVDVGVAGPAPEKFFVRVILAQPE